MLGATAALLLLGLAAGCANRLTEPRQYVVFFATNTAELAPEARQVMGQVAGDARDLEPSKVTVEGQADGGTAHDATLADQRAATVVQTLVASGVPAGTIDKRPSAPPAALGGVAAHKVIVRLIP